MLFLRSVLHMLWMAVTVVPWALAVLIAAPFLSSTQVYWMCAGWLKVAVRGGNVILGIRNQIIGYENLPVGSTAPAVLLLKHQSTWETFCMPTLMPHPLAYVFKRELLYVPFFGWAMGRLDMIHIDRSKRTEAWNLVAAQGRRLFAEKDLPKSVLDFAGPEWQGKVGFVPTSGAFQEQAVAIIKLHGREAAEKPPKAAPDAPARSRCESGPGKADDCRDDTPRRKSP